MKVTPSKEEGAVDIEVDDEDRKQMTALFFEEKVGEFEKLLDSLRDGKPIAHIEDPFADKSNDLIHYFFTSYSPAGAIRMNPKTKKMFKDTDGDRYGGVLRVLFERLSPGALSHYSSYPYYDKLVKTPQVRAKEGLAQYGEELEATAYSPKRGLEAIKAIYYPAAESVGTKAGRRTRAKRTRNKRRRTRRHV